MSKVKTIAIWTVVIVGSNIAGLHGYSATNSLAWCARTMGKIFVGTANAIQ